MLAIQFSHGFTSALRVYQWKPEAMSYKAVVLALHYTGRRRRMATTKQKRLPPIHPGEVLQDLLNESGLTVNALAMALRVPANRIGDIVKGRRGITADTALRLARYFGVSAQMWVNLQARYDLAAAEDALTGRIEREVLPRPAA
jgi:addiction module HigA family antidote